MKWRMRLLFVVACLSWSCPKVGPQISIHEGSDSLSVEGTSVSYVQISEAKPAKVSLRGPARFQADFRVNLKASVDEQSAILPVILDMFADGKPAERFRVQPHAGTQKWQGQSFKPSKMTGFYVEVGSGTEAWEFRIKGGELGAAIMLVDAATASAPLPSEAPTVKKPGK